MTHSPGVVPLLGIKATLSPRQFGARVFKNAVLISPDFSLQKFPKIRLRLN